MVYQSFSRKDIEGAFDELGRYAAEAGKTIDLAVFGGVAMMLTFSARPTTRDVDAVALTDGAFVRGAAKRIATARDWPGDWLNDAVKGFLSSRQSDSDTLALFRTYPSESTPGLRVFVARPEYLLAMKCIAMRIDMPGVASDIEDIKVLVRKLGLTTATEVLDIVSYYYPEREIPAKTQFGVEEIMERLAASGRNGHDA